MALTDLVKGFQIGWRYPSQENKDKNLTAPDDEGIVFDGPKEDYFFDQIFEEKAPKLERAGFYTALAVRHPKVCCEAFYEELKKELRYYLSR